MQPHKGRFIGPRGDWSTLLLAVCALLAASSSSRAQGHLPGANRAPYAAVLCWLHQSAEVAAPDAATLTHRALEARQSALLSALCQSVAPAPNADFAPLAIASSSEPPLVVKAAVQDSVEKSVASVALLDESCAVLSLSLAPRHDASRRLIEQSLFEHEAGARCGIRTNRFNE